MDKQQVSSGAGVAGSVRQGQYAAVSQIINLRSRQDSGQVIGIGGRQRIFAHPHTAESCQNCAQQRFCLPQGLEPAEVQDLEHLISRIRSVGRGDYLFRAGERQRSVYAVRSGVIKLSCSMSNGDEQVIGFRLPGDLFGLEALGMEICTNSAVAIAPSSVCQIPVAQLIRVSSESPKLQQQLYVLFARQIVNANLALTMLGKSKAESGLAALILSVAERYRARGYSSTDFNLSMSRAEIGHYLGITVETVSRLFSRFQKQGLLKVDKRHIVVRDTDRLRSMAGYPSTSERGRVEHSLEQDGV